MSRRHGAWWRRRIWVAASVALLAAYFVGTTHPARRTAIGTERYLFGIGGDTPELFESPEGDAWLLVPGSKATGPVTSQPWVNNLFSRVIGLRWPGPVENPRSLFPFSSSPVTYGLHGATLARVWRYAPSAWELSGYLADASLRYGSVTAILDLRTGRTYLQAAAQSFLQSLPALPPEDEELFEEETSVDISALEGVPPGEITTGERVRVNSRLYYLETRRGRPNVVSTLASTKEETPKTLLLAENAAPLKLSRDGKTLFFERNGALWRLDLVRPLPVLFEANPLPSLPEPPEENSVRRLPNEPENGLKPDGELPNGAGVIPAAEHGVPLGSPEPGSEAEVVGRAKAAH